MTGSTAPCLWKVPLNPGILDILATGAKGVLQLPGAYLLHKLVFNKCYHLNGQ